MTTIPIDAPQERAAEEDHLFLLWCEPCEGTGGYTEPCSLREYYENGPVEVECKHCRGFGDVVVDFDPDEIEMDEIEFAPCTSA